LGVSLIEYGLPLMYTVMKIFIPSGYAGRAFRNDMLLGAYKIGIGISGIEE
jgi:hypothetical protein